MGEDGISEHLRRLKAGDTTTREDRAALAAWISSLTPHWEPSWNSAFRHAGYVGGLLSKREAPMPYQPVSGSEAWAAVVPELAAILPQGLQNHRERTVYGIADGFLLDHPQGDGRAFVERFGLHEALTLRPGTARRFLRERNRSIEKAQAAIARMNDHLASRGSVATRLVLDEYESSGPDSGKYRLYVVTDLAGGIWAPRDTLCRLHDVDLGAMKLRIAERLAWAQRFLGVRPET